MRIVSALCYGIFKILSAVSDKLSGTAAFYHALRFIDNGKSRDTILENSANFRLSLLKISAEFAIMKTDEFVLTGSDFA